MPLLLLHTCGVYFIFPPLPSLPYDGDFVSLIDKEHVLMSVYAQLLGRSTGAGALAIWTRYLKDMELPELLKRGLHWASDEDQGRSSRDEMLQAAHQRALSP